MTFVLFSNQLFDPPIFEKTERVILVPLPNPPGVRTLHPVRTAWTQHTCEAYVNTMKKRGYSIELQSALPTGPCSFVDPCDIHTVRTCTRLGYTCRSLDSPLFLLTRQELNTVIGPKVRSNYIFFERVKKHMGLEWLGPSTDFQNRKPLKGNGPKDATLTPLPVTHSDAKKHLDAFLKERFAHFGTHQDAIVKDRTLLYHAHLSFLINVGLLTPRQVLDAVLRYKGRVPHNSLEGFVRQLLGWREYMRYLYVVHGASWWRSILASDRARRPPVSWVKGTTGIEPLDHEIRKLGHTAWAHHIVRLMVFLNWMRLQDIGPRAAYTWFMERVSLDAYDWVMVPNILTMGFYVRGFTHRPYISSSKYLLRMSDYSRGPWADAMDKLYAKRIKEVWREAK